jgi:nickel/cobalt transporter (NicO) family protein
MFQDITQIQREIYLSVAENIKLFAADGELLPFLGFLPLATLFGAVHALTPGHNKIVLATYLAGTGGDFVRGLRTSLILSFTHVTMAVLIAILALPLVSVALGSVGRAPLLEDISRALLALIGLWMVWRAVRPANHDHGKEGTAVALFAGLIPCPLTLFVMTFAIGRGVPQAGILFAIAMMIGVFLTLSAVAVLSVSFRSWTQSLLQRHPALLRKFSRATEGLAGLVLLGVAVNEIAFKS